MQIIFLSIDPNACIVMAGLKTKLYIAAYAPIAPFRAYKDHGVSLTPKMLHVRTGQSGFLPKGQWHGDRE